MNVGDYVRTEKGILKIRDDKPFKDDKNKLNYLTYGNYTCVLKENIIKSNPNILELLEPMDLLYIDISPDDCGGIVVPRIPETQNELNGFVEFIKSGHWILKGVVTREQIENNMYKVGE
jgi:hypothetical protein